MLGIPRSISSGNGIIAFWDDLQRKIGELTIARCISSSYDQNESLQALA